MKYSFERGGDNYTIHETGWSSSPRAVVKDLQFVRQIVDALNDSQEIDELHAEIDFLRADLAKTEAERQKLYDGAVQTADMH